MLFVKWTSLAIVGYLYLRYLEGTNHGFHHKRIQSKNIHKTDDPLPSFPPND